nr:MAG TPA: hypothetical protein [Caudoviricetes sp.]
MLNMVLGLPCQHLIFKTFSNCLPAIRFSLYI